MDNSEFVNYNSWLYYSYTCESIKYFKKLHYLDIKNDLNVKRYIRSDNFSLLILLLNKNCEKLKQIYIILEEFKKKFAENQNLFMNNYADNIKIIKNLSFFISVICIFANLIEHSVIKFYQKISILELNKFTYCYIRQFSDNDIRMILKFKNLIEDYYLLLEKFKNSFDAF